MQLHFVIDWHFTKLVRDYWHDSHIDCICREIYKNKIIDLNCIPCDYLTPCCWFWVYSLWEDEPASYKEINRFTTSLSLWNIDCLMTVKSYAHVICLYYNVVRVKSTWWLLMAWCIFGARTYATTMMTYSTNDLHSISATIQTGVPAEIGYQTAQC